MHRALLSIIISLLILLVSVTVEETGRIFPTSLPVSATSLVTSQVPAAENIDDVPYWIFRIAWSPDGSKLAIAKSLSLCSEFRSSAEGEVEPEILAVELANYQIYIVNPATGTIEAKLTGNLCSVTDLEWSPDGTKVLSASGDSHGFQIWDAVTGTLLARDVITGEGYVAANWRPNSPDELVVVDFPGNVMIHSALTGYQMKFVRSWTEGINTAAEWNNDGQRLAISSLYTRTIDVLAYPSLTVELQIAAPEAKSLAWSPTGDRISAVVEGVWKIWNSRTGELLLEKPFEDWPWPPDIITFGPDGQFVAARINRLGLIVCDAATGEEWARYENYSMRFTVDWSPDGARLAYSQSQPDGRPDRLIITRFPPET